MRDQVLDTMELEEARHHYKDAARSNEYTLNATYTLNIDTPGHIDAFIRSIGSLRP